MKAGGALPPRGQKPGSTSGSAEREYTPAGGRFQTPPKTPQERLPDRIRKIVAAGSDFAVWA
jgi:hypothetical protein